MGATDKTTLWRDVNRLTVLISKASGIMQRMYRHTLGQRLLDKCLDLLVDWDSLYRAAEYGIDSEEAAMQFNRDFERLKVLLNIGHELGALNRLNFPPILELVDSLNRQFEGFRKKSLHLDW